MILVSLGASLAPALCAAGRRHRLAGSWNSGRPLCASPRLALFRVAFRTILITPIFTEEETEVQRGGPKPPSPEVGERRFNPPSG